MVSLTKEAEEAARHSRWNAREGRVLTHNGFSSPCFVCLDKERRYKAIWDRAFCAKAPLLYFSTTVTTAQCRLDLSLGDVGCWMGVGVETWNLGHRTLFFFSLSLQILGDLEISFDIPRCPSMSLDIPWHPSTDISGWGICLCKMWGYCKVL